MSKGVIVFKSTQHAMRAEKVIKNAGFSITIMPVPRQISSDCGIAIRFSADDESSIRAELAKHNVEIAGIHWI